VHPVRVELAALPVAPVATARLRLLTPSQLQHPSTVWAAVVEVEKVEGTNLSPLVAAVAASLGRELQAPEAPR
jgi:hypothetical protein